MGMDAAIAPHSEQAERGLIGSLVIDGQRVLDICTEHGLVPGSFYIPAHRAIYDAATELATAGKVIDIITLGEALNKRGKLDQVGGHQFIDALVEEAFTSAHSEYYAEIVDRKWRLRQIIEECRETETACMAEDQAEDPAGIMSHHAQRINAIDGQRTGREAKWSDVVDESMRHIEQVCEQRTGLVGVSTGFLALDNSLLGLKPKCMYVLAARPMMGKTSLALNIAENVSLGFRDPEHKPRAVGVFSLEMGSEELALRMKCSHARVNVWNLIRGFSKTGDVAKLVEAAAVLKKAPIHACDKGGLDVAELRFRARRWMDKHGIALLIVDYLQLLRSREYMRQGRPAEIGFCSQNMKECAKELNIPVLVCCQLNRNPELRNDDGRPRLADLRDTGQIEQDADGVVLLHRPCKYPKHEHHDDETLAIAEIVKHRMGPTGEAHLNFHEQFTRFEDRTEEPDVDYDGM